MQITHLPRYSHEHWVFFEKKLIKIDGYIIHQPAQISTKCPPRPSPGGLTFGRVLATPIPRYTEVPQTIEPGTARADEKPGLLIRGEQSEKIQEGVS
ncbi:MAG: hypothetical protein CSA33_03230 [Desulfobulbus propionicus]|nr:MAG: hypothetical protein CSA33_03230 [Desulfobulbus propionicus]